MRGRLISSLFVVVASMASAVVARAGEPERALDVTFEEAIRLGRSNGQRARVARVGSAAVPEIKRASDGLALLPPRVTLVGGLRHGLDGDHPELGASLLQDLPMGGLGAARREAAGAIERVSASQEVEARRDSAASGARAWIELAEASRVLALRQAASAEAEALAKLSATRVKAGVVDPLEAALAASEVATARASVLEAEGRVVEGEASLRLAIGASADQPVRSAGELDTVDATPIEEAAILRAARAHRPSSAGLAARAELAHADAKISIAVLASPLGLGVSWLREGTGDHVVTALIAIPLPLVSPGAFDASRARVTAKILGAEIEADGDRLTREVHAAVHEREHTREMLEAVSFALPPSQEALRLANARLAAGTIDVGAVLVARARLAAAAERRVRAAADARRADVRLEELRGALDRETP